MRREFDKFILRNTVLDGARKMKIHLLGLAKRNERGARYQAAVSLRQLRTLPDVAEQDLVAERGQLRRQIAKLLACGGGYLRHSCLSFVKHRAMHQCHCRVDRHGRLVARMN